MKTPEQKAQEYKERDMAKGNGVYYNSGRVPAYLAGLAEGKLEEREKHLSDIRGLIAIYNRFEGVRIIDRLLELEKELEPNDK